MKTYTLTIEAEDDNPYVVEAIGLLTNIEGIKVSFTVTNAPLTIDELVDMVKDLPAGRPPSADVAARRNKVLKMFKAGKSRGEIAEKLEVTPQTISNDRRILQEEGRI